MEIAVDVLILHGTKDDTKARAAYVYEESQKLIAAQRLEQHFHGRPAPANIGPIIGWGRRNAKIVEQWRQEVWGHTGKVARWTSPSKRHSVIDDAREIQAKYRCGCWSEVVENIHDVCVVTLDMLHWGTHGSGGALLRGEGTDPVGMGSDVIVNAVAMSLIVVEAMRCEAPSLFLLPAIREPYDDLQSTLSELEKAFDPEG